MPLSSCSSTSEEAARILSLQPHARSGDCCCCWRSIFFALALQYRWRSFRRRRSALVCPRAEVLSLQVLKREPWRVALSFFPRVYANTGLCVSYPLGAPREERSELLQDSSPASGTATDPCKGPRVEARRRRSKLAIVMERHGTRAAASPAEAARANDGAGKSHRL